MISSTSGKPTPEYVSSEILLRRDGIAVLQPRIFSTAENLICGISTRLDSHRMSPYGMNISFKVGDDPVVVQQNRDRLFSLLGFREEDLAVPSQVHGNRVSIIDKPGKYDDHDALITSVEGVYLAITIADCVPILLYDPLKKIVAVVHSGWRGCRSKILTEALRMMMTSYHSEPRDVHAYLGPSAGVCCYEIGADVADYFAPQYLDLRPAGRPHVDLKGINRDILLDKGIIREHIEISEYCTICHPELFHSYRRENKTSGRMMAIIGLKPE